ncbi:MAG: HAMP domain-containing histidine kinase [Saprospiraceae bacterium]|nr:HAMP domain-containing histidine kinase [Saprospiraceae bacterium]
MLLQSLSHRRIVLLASLALLGMMIVQANWIWTSYELKREDVHNELMELTPKVAVQVKIAEEIIPKVMVREGELPNISRMEQLVDSMMQAAGFLDPVYFALYQKSSDSLYLSNTTAFEPELRSSPYTTCMSCIITYRFLSDSTEAVTPEMTSIRPVSEMKRLPGYLPSEEFVWLSLHMPNQQLLSQRAILGLFLLSMLMMGILIYLFAHILNALSLQKKLGQMKDDFVNNLTHEFKTPLGAIRLASSVLRHSDNPKKRATYLDLIANESKRLEEQVDRMLQLSTLDAGRDGLEKETLNLHELIKEVVDRLRPLLVQKKGEIDLQLNLENAEIEADRDHFGNCIYNLIDNAIKYGGVTPKIAVITSRKGGTSQVIVRDQGPGIPPAHQEAIFDRFYRAQEDDRYKGKGFGIGLSYVKTIVDAHGARVRLNRHYKAGCEFIIELS